MSAVREARLVLADGTVFEGEALGATEGAHSGEVVFNTVMSGYQEVLTDPSYAGQIITFTYPHIGNYGVTAADDESRSVFCRGAVVRDLARVRSNWRSETDLRTWLVERKVPVIGGVDTRRLTRHIRRAGAMAAAFGTAPRSELLELARSEPGTAGVDLVSEVTTDAVYTAGSGPWNVVAYDLGMKKTMVRRLAEFARVTVVPASTPAAEVLALEPDGVFLSNGPGDPEMVEPLVGELGTLLGRVPVFGICLGHQVLALALGGRTFKMKFGHHGGNVPVRNSDTGRVEITSQNHNYAVEAGSVPGVEETHICLNDGVLEGLRAPGQAAFSVQYHPEAAPGPHDSRYLFADFIELMEAARAGTAAGAR